MRRSKQFIGSSSDHNDQLDKPKKIDAILISHRYDDQPIYLTIPEIYENQSSNLFGNETEDPALNRKFQKELVLMLDEIVKVISNNSQVAPDLKRPLGAASRANNSAVPPPTFELDQTNKTPVGKILVDILSIKNFPYFNNIYVRISCNPWVVQTRCVVDQALDFK